MRKNILFNCSDFSSIPIKESVADIVLDHGGTSGYSFSHKDFLLKEIDYHVKREAYLIGTFINFKNFSTKSKIQPEYRHYLRMENIRVYMYNRKNILGLFLTLISLNFFLSFAVTVPLPYIVNTILELSSKLFGMIQAAFPAGMIVGALIVKKVTSKVAYPLLMKILSLSLAVCMIVTGIPVIFAGQGLDQLFYGAYYIGAMFLFGLIVAFIDIPLSYFMQKEVPEEYRGRVMSIGISIGKTMVPLAMVISGVLLDLVPPYLLPIGGGMLFLAISLLSSKKMAFSLSLEASSRTGEASH